MTTNVHSGTAGARTAELRLALVCYGGVSLAIYMHGITKELQKLLRAARSFDELADLDGGNPFGAETTEAAYFEALRELARDTGRRLSVSIDIIAGTSAGGINGVVLAKAIARDADQEPLKRLWIDEGDLKKLLRAPRIGGVVARGVLAATWQLVRLNKPTSPLRGEVLSRLLVGALGDMDADRDRSTLLPPGGELALFVTATDLHGFEVLVPSGAGGASQRDRSHGQVLQFRAASGDTSGFGPEANPALAFSARATSSFPGAFAPVSLESFGAEAKTMVEPAGDLFRFPYDENGLRSEDAWFADGGVLDNAPFDLVIDAIARRRARTEVLRHLVYIQPDPGRPLRARHRRAEDRGPTAAEGWLSTLWHIAGRVRSSHPILLELLKLRDLNWRISRVGAIADCEMGEVLRHLEKAVADAGLDIDGIDSKEHVRTVADAMHDRARSVLGPAFATYQRLKVDAAGRRLADEIARRFVFPPDSSRSSFIRAALAAWARSRPEWSDPDPTRLIPLLGPVDIPYRERRLMFMIAGVNDLYRPHDGAAPGPPVADLDRLKSAAWGLLAGLYDVPRTVVGAVPDETVRFLSAAAMDGTMLDRPEDFAAEHAEDFARLFVEYRDALEQQLGEGSGPLWRLFETETRSWDACHRRELLSRYLGFPLWDGLIFPVIALSELPQFKPIGVSQFSPLTASVLTTPPGGKLKGVTLRHFSAFLHAEWRENDYLWGRLDGAELILRTLYGAQRATPTDPSVDLGAEPPETALQVAGGRHLVAALRAVLSSERDLRGIAALRKALEAEVDGLEGSLGVISG